jgi:hypothetical protein
MKKCIYVICIAVIVGTLIFYYISTQSLVNQLKDSLTVSNMVVSDLQYEYSKLKQMYDSVPTYNIKLNEPTYEQVKEVLKDLKALDGNCLDKTKYVQDAFYDKGLQCYIVISNYKGGFGHSTVAFNTEKGWIYVEPDGMEEIKIVKDMPYYIPNRVYEGPVGMTAQDFAEKNTVTQLMILR